MLGEIIAIGNELTSGRIVNTTSGFAAHHLFEAGFDIYAMHTIGDTPELIGEALKRALKRVDFVIVTGGLGPTDDDLTTEAVSKALNRPTLPNLEILSLIRKHLDASTGERSESLEKLAWLPEGAETLSPETRMAGFQLVHNNKPVFFLPGIPHQMRTLLVEQVLPRLATWYAERRLTSSQKVFKIFGITEHELNHTVNTIPLDERVEIGYYPVFPDVHLSMTIRGDNENETDQLAQKSFRLITDALGSLIYGTDSDSMESIVGKLLLKNNASLGLAESCTGGLISHLITSASGSSGYFLGAVTSYANSMKTDFLGVRESLLKEHGAVSEAVAVAMARGMRIKSNADIAISVTGIAGPGGSSDGKPVGTVFIAISTENGTGARRFQFAGNRYEIQRITAQTALDMIRKHLLTMQQASNT